MASRYSLFTNSDAVKAIQLVISSVGIDTPVTNAKPFTTTALQVGVTYSATATKNGVTKNITLSVMTDHFSYDVNTPFFGFQLASGYSVFTNSDATKAIQLVISSVGIDTPVTNAKTFTTTALQVGVTYSATATKNGVTKNITLSVMTDHFSYDVNTPFYGGF